MILMKIMIRIIIITIIKRELIITIIMMIKKNNNKAYYDNYDNDKIYRVKKIFSFS